MKTIYISRSNDVPAKLTTELTGRLLDWFPGYDIKMWKRGSTYTDSALISSDYVIFLLGNSSAIIGKGAYKEYQTAMKYGKTVLIGYKRQHDNTLQLYSINGCKELYEGKWEGKADWMNYARLGFGEIVTDKMRRRCGEPHHVADPVAEYSPLHVNRVEVLVRTAVVVKQIGRENREMTHLSLNRIPVKLR